MLRRRATTVRLIREFFDGRGYLAVDTPALCPTPIPEAHIELFETWYRAPGYGAPDVPVAVRAAGGRRLALVPSPEYWLKRLIAAGAGNVYEIAHSFRNGESIGPHHQIEFQMLEYYTVGADAAQSLAITEALLGAVGVTGEALVVTMAEAFNVFAGIDLGAWLAEAASAPSADPDAMTPEGRTAAEEAFQRTFLSRVEPELPRDRPVFITDYPAVVPTLARRRAGTPWSERWELYLGGIEVANCFAEETDRERVAAFLASQAAEVAAAAARSETRRHAPFPVDDAFLQPPRTLPPCSGVALGVDRLVMSVHGAASIEEVIPFAPIV